MIRSRVLLATLLAAPLFASGAARAGGKELLLYNWTDYTSPEMIKKFEAESGIKVTLDTYDSNETLLAKLKSGGTGYDIIVPSSDFVPVLIKEGLLEKVNASKLPGYENVGPRWREEPWDPGNVYTIPWQWGLTSAIVDTAVYKGPTDSLKVLFDPPSELKGKIGMFGSPSEVVSLALTYMGKPICDADPADMKALSALLEKQKPSVKLYNSDGIRDRMVAGETALHQSWSGDSMRARLDKSSLKFIYGKEGAVLWVDNLAIPKGAKNPESARKFFEFMMKPENAAMETNFAGYQTGIEASLKFVRPDYASAPEFNMPAGYPAKFAKVCPEAATKIYDRIWTKLRQ